MRRTEVKKQANNHFSYKSETPLVYGTRMNEVTEGEVKKLGRVSLLGSHDDNEVDI